MGRLRLYHQMLNESSVKHDPQDIYDNYVWKVDIIMRHKRRTNGTYVFVRWKQGNYSWITLKSLRLHDPFSCVMYAIEKKLTKEAEWSWITDLIDDIKTFHKLIHALKTVKSMGPKY